MAMSKYFKGIKQTDTIFFIILLYHQATDRTKPKINFMIFTF